MELNGSKSVKVLNGSVKDESVFNPTESIMLGSQNESCIQVNRKAVRESRPPFNLGDDEKSSSHHDELGVGACDYSINDSVTDQLNDDTLGNATCKHVMQPVCILEEQHLHKSEKFDLSPLTSD